MAFRTSHILSCPLCPAKTIGAASLTPLIGEARRIKKNPIIFNIDAANALSLHNFLFGFT
jgi:hypothetical protein